MKLKYTAIAVLLLLFTVVQVRAQTCRYSIQGFITDESDGAPLEFVTVFLKDFQKGSVSDSSGGFRIESVCPGTVIIQLSHIGCETVEKRLEINSDTILYFTLPHSANLLQAVDISSEKLPAVMVPSETLSAREIDQTRGGTLAGALESVSGVTSIKTGSSIQKPVIHGLYGNRVLIFNNGVRLESQQWGNEHAPEVDPFVASKLTVVKGAGSVRYGSDALGGVVLAEPSAIRDSAGTGGQIDLVGFTNGRGGAVSGMVEHRFLKLTPLSVRLQGTLKRAGNNQTPDYYLKNTGMSEFDFSWAVNWKKEKYGIDIWYSQYNSELAIFSGSHIGNLTDFENALQSEEPAETSGFSYEIARPYQNVVHELVKTGGWISTGNGDKLSLIYSRQYNLREEYDKDVPLDDSLAALNLPELSYELTSHIADLVWEHYDNANFSGVVGISGKTAANTFEGRFFIPNYELTSLAVFATEKFNSGNFGLEAGARYEEDNMDVYINTGEEIVTEPYSYNGLTGSVSASWKVNDHWDLLFNTNTAWRAPSVNELYADGLHHGAAAVEIGDKSLQEEKALSMSFTANLQSESRYFVSVSAYHSIFDGFIYLQPEPPPTVIIQGTFPTFFYRQADATITGADLTTKWNTGQLLTLELRAAGVVARNTSKDEYLPGFPPFRTSAGVIFSFKDQGHFTNLKAGIKGEYVAEQSFAPEEDYLPPPEAYALVTLTASGTLMIDRFRCDVSISAENLLNTSYRDYLNRYRYYADDLGRNVILRLKIPFNQN